MKRSKVIPAIAATLRSELPGVRITGAPNKFARGNRAASKGEPRTVSLTVRIPASTDAEIRRRAEREGLSRADVIIAAVRFSPG